MKILVVEDSAQYQEAALSGLSSHEVTCATDLEEAIALLDSQQFDTVITDMFFPESREEEFGPISRKIMDEINSKKWDKKGMSSDWKPKELDKTAPLGLAVIARACEKGMPVAFFSDADRHDGALGYVRYALETSEGCITTFSVNYGEKRRSWNKSKPKYWALAVKFIVDKSARSSHETHKSNVSKMLSQLLKTPE